MDVRATSTTVDTEACCSALRSTMPPESVAATAARFKALGDPTRVRLLRLVARSGAGEACVCDLTDAVGLSQPTTSHHLSVLVRAGLLTRERRGTWAWYAVTDSAAATLRADLDGLWS